MAGGEDRLQRAQRLGAPPETAAPGGGGRSTAAATPGLRGPASSAPLVQRKVGFEFETGWLVRTGPPTYKTPTKKKQSIGTSAFDGFKMEADEAGGGEGEIEFIVHPPIDEGKSGYERLDDVMSDMETFGRVLEAKAGAGRPFTLNQVTAKPQDYWFKVFPHAEKLKAGPQVTSGLDLAKIADLASMSRARENPGSRAHELFYKGERPAPTELDRSLQQLSRSAAAIRTKHENVSAELNGLLVVIKNYLDIGGDQNKEVELNDFQRWAAALDYPKIIADRLLARTNLAKLFRLIPAREQKLYVETPELFFTLVDSVTADFVDLDDSVIERGVKDDAEDPDQGITKPPLSVRQWLQGILDNVDLLTSIEDAESLGEMGAKTEKVGEKGLFSEERDVGIFEFRGAQTSKIPLERWKPFALDFQQFITIVHGD